MKTIKIRSNSLMLHLAIVMTLFITIIEGVLLLSSYQSQKNKLFNLRAELSQEILVNTGKQYHEVHPKTLSDQDIEQRLHTFSRNVIMLVLLIIVVVVLGTSIVFYFVAGRHILKLRSLILSSSNNSFHFYPEELIPNNDLGDVIRNRNSLLQNVEGYQKNLEQKLEEAKQSLVHSAKLSAVGESTSAIAHDLKNPLTILINNIKILQRKCEDENILGKLEKMHFASTRIKRLVDRMNRFSRDDFSLENDVDLLKVLSNSQVLLESKINSNNVKINTKTCEDTTSCKADEGSLEQVFMNLISNAIDAMEDSDIKEINIETSRHDDLLNISFKDTGPGVPQESQDKVFNAFFTSKESGKGTGLGLSICKKIVEMHEGQLELNPHYKEGAEFVVSLPA